VPFLHPEVGDGDIDYGRPLQRFRLRGVSFRPGAGLHDLEAELFCDRPEIIISNR
jgi:hypothetical protein